ncbi:MAG: GAF domain-containing sensor histidine kinase [Pseudomonadota bacterium]|nr:GAF domain-containing sensor histidine kinase [Pseudomonadota bacterium]
MESRASDSAEDIASDVAAVGRIEAVPTLLRVLCDTTGMGFAAVARVTDGTWTACAVHDDIAFGLKAGGQLDVHSTLCKEVRATRLPVVIDQASADPLYRAHHTPRFYGIESYISVPIVLDDGEYFGNLCAIDRRPAKATDPRVISMFTRFAELIGHQLDGERKQEKTQTDLFEAHANGELREQFIAVLGHDLRSPLSAIAACSQLLQRKTKEPDTANLAARITANTMRMSRLIDDVLDFARGRLDGGIGLGLVEADHLDQALSAVVAEMSDTHPGRTIRGHVAIGRKVRCDPGRIQQLASNLLANAIAHGSRDGPVEFDARIAGDSLLIDVKNDGEVIPEASIGDVFRPFWRRSESGRSEGLGLGLHICDQIVKAHHGHIDVTSSRESGTRFSVRLPIGAAAAP